MDWLPGKARSSSWAGFYMRGLGVSVEVFVLVIAEVWGDSVVAWTRVSCMGFVVPSVSDRLRESPA